MIKPFILIILVCTIGKAWGQTSTDSTVQQDTSKLLPVISKPVVPKKPHHSKRDSIQRKLRRDSALARAAFDTSSRISLASVTNQTVALTKWEKDSFKYAGHPYFKFTDPVRYSVVVKKWFGKEDIFYSLIAILIFFAIIKNGFRRYISDLFKIFFRTSIRQRQIKDQLIQSPLPSLLLNIFFILIAGLYIDILLRNYGMGMQYKFWLLFVYAALALIIVYGIKFITLKFFGWVFQVSDTIETYIFIVFTTNKIAGIFLLPFIVVLSFSYGLLHDVSITLSITLVISLFAYRYFLSYISIQRQLNISLFHFLIYFCAFELAPVLLINKLLFRFLTETS
ncbi:MAG TPA: DUF4271 domain-containing protein [Flavisolibacter sp.]|nr:DUF4271 domain-containing protein [Flavisolibacter sp.]